MEGTLLHLLLHPNNNAMMMIAVVVGNDDNRGEGMTTPMVIALC
jgi:hypothetical protein